LILIGNSHLWGKGEKLGVTNMEQETKKAKTRTAQTQAKHQTETPKTQKDT